MKVLVLCGATPNEWQLEFARLLGHALHEHRCTCLVGGYTLFVRELVASGVLCTGYAIEPEEKRGHSIVKCAHLLLDDFPKTEEVWGIRTGLFMTEPDAYIMVGKSEGLEGTLPLLSPLLSHNKALKQSKPFVLVDWGVLEREYIRSIFGIPVLTPKKEGEIQQPLNTWFTGMPPQPFESRRAVGIALSTLGLSESNPTSAPKPAPTPA